MLAKILTLIIGLVILATPNVFSGEPGWIVPAGKIGLVVIDVGAEGDAQLVLSPNRKSLLIDTGDNNEKVAWPNLEKVLQDNKVETLDILVITHPHQDHLGNVMRVMKNFAPRLVVLSGSVHTNPTYQEMLIFIRDNNVPARQVRTGDKLEFDEGVTVEILGPNDVDDTNLNNTSVIVKVTYGHFSALITGDAEVEQEQEQLSLENKLSSVILKAGHHGSKTSSSLAYLQAVAPQHAIVSAGGGNQYGHPHGETLSRLEGLGIPALITRDLGTITVISDGKSYEVRTSK